jgi:hypothetical protein
MKPIAYAADTTVSVERSRLEVEMLLAKHGAQQRAVLVDDEAGHARVGFVVAGRKYVLEVPLPVRPTGVWPKENGKEPPGWGSWSAERRSKFLSDRWQQECRSRWRAVVLLMKAKLELVRIGLSTVEREFLADLVLPDGRTAGQTIGAYVAKLIADGYNAPLALPEARP